MIKFFSSVIYKVLFFLNLILNKIIKKDFLLYFKEFLEKDAYIRTDILGNKVKFFSPNQIIKWRVETYFSKEPETIEWIDNFKKQENVIFWDIGANIGLYSIYAAIKFKNIEVVSFEPSTSNLRVLSRNISINKLEKKIKIFQIPLTEKNNQFLMMRESEFIEGASLHSFGEKIDHEGKFFEGQNNYKIYGTSIDYLIKNNILKVPHYIKIDVDGIEHLIMKGALQCLSDVNVRSISIELNENFKEQYDEVFKIMKDKNFTLKHKKRSSCISFSEHFEKTYNYIYEK